MDILVMVNGEYGDWNWYRGREAGFGLILCADGGANAAAQLGIKPDQILGDMDSIDPKVADHYQAEGVTFAGYPRAKNETDTQLAYAMALEAGAESVTVWGGLGGRLDHTLSTLMSALQLLRADVAVCFEGPGLTIHLMREGILELTGVPGETMSLIILSEEARITLAGFAYPLADTPMKSSFQWAVCNEFAESQARIELTSGEIAVFHYHTG